MLTETVSTPITTTILPPADASLPELRKLQREWLEAAREAGHLLACRIIARTLGEKYELRYRREYDCHHWESGTLKIDLWEWDSAWLPHRQDYTQSYCFTVHYAGQRVCKYYETTGPSTQANENHFIPGSWTEELADPLAQAEQIISDRHAAELEAQRQELLTRLLGL